MAVELDHSFTTAKPIDESYAADHRPRARGAVRRGRQRDRETGDDSVKARDQGQDGRDVDDVHRHGRDHREGRRRPSRDDGVKSREAGGQGYANATVTFALHDGGGTIHTNAQITRQGRLDGRGRGGRRARRADRGLHRQARGDIVTVARWRRSRCGRCAQARCPRRRHGGPGGSRPARVQRQRPRRLRLRRVRQRARRRR